MKVDVLVLGAGISGLTAAYHLQENGFNTFIVEKEGAVGGRVQSAGIGNFLIDFGALFLTNSYKHTYQLIRNLGIGDQVKRINTQNGIVVGNRIFTLPPHSFVDIARLLPLSSLLKLPRMMLEVMLHTGELQLYDILKSFRLDTESVADFSMRHGDSALLNYLIDPILQGIWYWNSISTTKIALYLLLKQAPTMRLYTLANGMSQLSNTLAQHLQVNLATQAIQSKYEPETKTWKTIVRDAHGEHTIESKVVLCALPAMYINSIFTNLPDSVRSFFAGIRYTSIVTVHLLLKEKTTIPHFYGLYYPSTPGKAIAAVAIQSNKILSQDMPNGSALSVYATTEFSQELFGGSEEEITRAILRKLESLYPFAQQDLSQNIAISKIMRLNPALPVFHTGYISKLKLFDETLRHDLPPGIFFAGDFLGGPHIEGAVVSAENVLPRIKNFLQN
jgi:protoporphyrinogen/coproporphyrinogen III oxidase